MACPVFGSSHLLGKKWVIPIVEELALGSFLGFNRFVSAAFGITPRVLSMRLSEMESAGLIVKTPTNGQTRYTLTGKGLELHELITDIKKWNVKWNSIAEECVRIPCTRCDGFLKRRP